MGMDSIKITARTKDRLCRMNVAGELTIYNAARLKDELMDRLRRSDGLELRLEEVTEMDTAGLQLLLLVRREAALAGKRACIFAPSPQVRQVLDLYHLTAELDVVRRQERSARRRDGRAEAHEAKP